MAKSLPESLLFYINKYSHIKQMSIKCFELGIPDELIYVANELCDNMLKAETIGTIEIFPKEQTVINGIKGNKERYKELYMFLSIARYVYRNKEKIFPSKGVNEFKSRGFLSMFYSDWLLDVVSHGYASYEIIARKNKH